MTKGGGSDSIAVNRQASYLYTIGEKFEAGLMLEGPEVKSIRERRVNLKDSFCRIGANAAWLMNMHVSPWPFAGRPLDPTRSRKLLLHKREIARLTGLVRQKGYTLIPLSLYFKRGRIKIQVALCKGKRQYDKRQDAKTKMHRREMERALRKKGGGR